MITRDYHGWAHDDAVADAELTVGMVRIKGHIREAEFITGHGSIRQAVFDLLKEHDLTPHFKFGNTGTIVVTIE